MTGPTHKQYAITFGFLLAIILYNNGLTEINYYLSLPIILQISKYGAMFPDVDHHWGNVKDKNVPNKIINMIIRATGGKHRSWQTHSIDIMTLAVLVSYFLPNYLYDLGKLTEVNREVLSLVMLSFSAGWVSHIISDMMTSAGVRLLCFKKYKVKIVPKSIGSLRFNTGNEWEAFVYKCTRVINISLGCLCLIYPYIDRIAFI